MSKESKALREVCNYYLANCGRTYSNVTRNKGRRVKIYSVPDIPRLITALKKKAKELGATEITILAPKFGWNPQSFVAYFPVEEGESK